MNLTSLSYGTSLSSPTPVYRSTSDPINALVDTGSTYTLLPSEVVNALAEELDAWNEAGEWKVDCALRDVAGTVNFGFEDVLIRVPYADFLLRVQDDSCWLGVKASEADGGGKADAILGDTFLRGAYGESSLALLSWLRSAKRCCEMFRGDRGADWV